jgi:hypothetical protein
MSGPNNDLQRRIGVETRLKGYTYFEIERDFFNKLGVLIDGDFKLVYCYLSNNFLPNPKNWRVDGEYLISK